MATTPRICSIFQFLRFGLMALFLVLMAACGGGAGTVGIPSGNALHSSAPSSVSIPVGTTASYTIGGGTPIYSAQSDTPTITKASIAANGTTLTIEGLTSGVSQISITDAAGASVTFSVTVGDGGTSGTATPLYTTAASAIILASGGTSSFKIGGGTAPYTATSSNTSNVTANVSGTTLSLIGLNAGIAQVLVFDSKGASVTIGVTVTQIATTPLTVQPDGASGNVGDVLTFIFSGGAPVYAATVNNASIATLSPITASANGGSFTATLLNVGSTDVTLADSTGQTKSFTLTASQISTALRLSPSTILIGEDDTSAIVLNIYGGTGPYRAFTSDQTLTAVSTSGATLTVALGSNLNRCINPIDSSGVRVVNGTFDVTLTVLDSLGASATTIMTIKDNGIGNGSVAVQTAPFVAPCQ